MRVTLTVDGKRHDLDVGTGRTLADVLGAECGVPGCRLLRLVGQAGQIIRSQPVADLKRSRTLAHLPPGWHGK